MPLRLRRRARRARHVAIGVDGPERVWAISVDGADPLVIGGTDDTVAALVCAAANTLELSDRKLRAGLVWGAGPYLRQSYTLPPGEFREVISGETSKTGDSLHLMALARREREQAAAGG